MTVLSLQDFKEKSSPGINSWERSYLGKPVTAGPIFSLRNLKAAALYCKKFTKQTGGAVCIIVREKSFLRIWSENFLIKQQPAKRKVNHADKSSLSKEIIEVSTNSLPVEAKYIDFCQKILAEFIGPVAPILCKRTLAKKANLNREQFVDILAKKISDPQQATDFRRAVLE